MPTESAADFDALLQNFIFELDSVGALERLHIERIAFTKSLAKNDDDMTFIDEFFDCR